jgi:predicted enzyme related to lactoylglutathione lyase
MIANLKHAESAALISGLPQVGSETVKLKQVYLTAAQPEGLADFYEAFGLTIGFADHGKWIQFAGEKTAFCIAGPSESASDQSKNAVLVFEVDDLETAVERARALGGETLGEIRDMGAHGRVAQLKDPQKNTIALFQAASK